MYEYLEGKVARSGPARLVVDVAGVGYDLAVPIGARFEGADSKGTVRVWTHLAVRDDAHELYGFPDRETRELFRLLLRVRGVGGGLALGILSSLPGNSLLEAIAAENLKAFTAIRGVGKKTAEQILLDLRDKAPQPSQAGSDVLVPRASDHANGSVEDAVSALSSIGYSEKEARRSVDRALKKTPDADLETLVRIALRE